MLPAGKQQGETPFSLAMPATFFSSMWFPGGVFKEFFNPGFTKPQQVTRGMK